MSTVNEGWWQGEGSRWEVLKHTCMKLATIFCGWHRSCWNDIYHRPLLATKIVATYSKCLFIGRYLFILFYRISSANEPCFQSLASSLQSLSWAQHDRPNYLVYSTEFSNWLPLMALLTTKSLCECVCHWLE